MKTISQWLDQGGFKCGKFLLDLPMANETVKAIGFACQKYNTNGNLIPSICWFPKNMIHEVKDDFYLEKSKNRLFLVPTWLYMNKKNDGYCF
ncbi:hypothetical protein ACMYR3_17050 (plasmid) [Ampullimonas aquatilis]|uniref:hypothetical protein n=1 Tax=Ampullimonas aquatilis TaxID=1341549 RepID=UPI003C736D85